MLCGGRCVYGDSVCAYVAVPIAAGILDKKIDIEEEVLRNLFSDISAWGYFVEVRTFCVIDEALQDDGVRVHDRVPVGVVSYTT